MARQFVPTPLKLRRPVPSDIEIAQEASLKRILRVAEKVQLSFYPVFVSQALTRYNFAGPSECIISTTNMKSVS
jgi:hypothetical protein